MNTKLVVIFLILAVVSTHYAQAQQTPPMEPQSQMAPAPEEKGAITKGDKATADMVSKSGSKVTGTISLSDTATGIQGTYKLQGLTPNKTFGMHIHEKGDCTSPDGKSAGSHYMKMAPTGGTSLQTPEKYAGDLPQIKSDKDGKANGTFQQAGLTINKKNPVANHAIIVHDGGDDVTKASAPRIACGVISATKTK